MGSLGFRNHILGGMILGGGIWFIWIIFLLGKTLYGNWFYMSLNPSLEAGLWSFDYCVIIFFGLVTALVLGVIGGVLIYGFKKVFNIQSPRKAETESRELIKKIINCGNVDLDDEVEY